MHARDRRLIVSSSFAKVVVAVLLVERQLAPLLATRLRELLGPLDPLDEAAVRRAQRQLRIDVQPAREVDDGEEEVAHLVHDRRVRRGLGGRLAGTRDLGLQLAELLAHLGERALEVGPVEAGGDRAALQLARLHERGERAGHVVEDAGAPFLLRLDLLPPVAHAAGRRRLGLAEHVWMTPHELRVHVAGDRLEIAVALLREEQGEEVDLKQQVAELVEQLRRVGRIGGSGIRDLVGLLDRVRDDRQRRLLAVPRAVPA